MDKEVRKAALQLAAFRRGRKPPPPLRLFDAFLAIAKRDGYRNDITMPELRRTVFEDANSSTTRGLQLLGKEGFKQTGRPRVPGMQLVETYPDPEDGRVLRVRLTPEGRRMKHEIDEIGEL